ncbi:MAG: ATP-binding cassette domain-containing protein [Oscillospiraceae bacterium]|jgi:putative multiple sugar transport system ATP-binding protein|nr:ATP-binding cassette domain-containing protein [Oscillospiraceae bacterium]
MQSITKEFPGVRALSGVNLAVREGDIHGVVGENGAGKSTLMNILSGIYPYGSYEGRFFFGGEECRFHSIADSERKGIVIIHQELALVPYLSIAENMFLGNEQSSRGVIRWDDTYRKAEEHLRTVGLTENTHTLIKDIGVGKQQLVEIAKALTKNVKLLILDEPTSSLNERDAHKLLDMLLDFKRTRGITSIIISHKLNEIAYVSDRITVLRDGMTIETLEKGKDDITENRIIHGMVGRDMSQRYPSRKPCVRNDIALRASHWNVYHPLFTEKKLVDDVSINVRRGEVVGMYGLIGAGRTELAMSIFGRAYGAHITGELMKDGKPIELTSIPRAIKAGFAYITEDRKQDGLILSFSILRNITLASMRSVSSRGVIDADLERTGAADTKERLNVKAPNIEQQAGNLSGGNQQKVLLGKWVFAKPDILMLDEPTRGVDVGAKYEIYKIINELAEQGKAILFISSELPEILGMCDRVYVMHEGRLIAEYQTSEATQERIMSDILATEREKSTVKTA